MKNAAPNIAERKNGFLVYFRTGIGDQVRNIWVPKCEADRAASFARAIRIRDAAMADARRSAPKSARSNTGVTGVSDTIQWKRGRPYPCIVAYYRERGADGIMRSKNVRFIYGGKRTRPQAFEAAVRVRRRRA